MMVATPLARALWIVTAAVVLSSGCAKTCPAGTTRSGAVCRYTANQLGSAGAAGGAPQAGAAAGQAGSRQEPAAGTGAGAAHTNGGQSGGAGTPGADPDDPCKVDNGGCDRKVTCTNEGGEPACGNCPDGYRDTHDDGSECVDLDECAENNGGCDASHGVCKNTPGARDCSCTDGYQGDGLHCSLNAPCSDDSGCDALAACQSVDGQRVCVCDEGYEGNGKRCTDIDECTRKTAMCPDDSTCTNTPGDAVCACKAGYAGLPGACTDIDECAEHKDFCAAGACKNDPGSFHCICPEGSSGDGRVCTDIDECAAANGGCEETCINEPSGMHCECANAGTLKADGKTCAKWSAATQVSVDSGNVLPLGFQVRQRGGHGVAAWSHRDPARTDGSVDVYTSRIEAGRWAAPNRVGAPSWVVTLPTLAINEAGVAVVVWQAKASKDAAESHAFGSIARLGASWSAPVQLDQSDAGSAQSAIDKDGNALAVWTANDAAGATIWAAYYSATSASWSGAERISGVLSATVQGIAESPQLVMNDQGDAIATWTQSDGTTPQLWGNTFAAARWVRPVRIDVGASVARDAQSLAIDGTGTSVVAWVTGTGSVWMRSHGTSSGLSDAKQLSASGVNPVVMLNRTGDGVLLWSQGNSTWQSHYAPGSGAAAPVQVPIQAVRGSTALRDDGSAVAAWNTGAVYASQAGMTWAEPALLAEKCDCSVSCMNVTAAEDGSAHAYWVTAKSLWWASYE